MKLNPVQRWHRFKSGLTSGMNSVAAVAIGFMMFLTVADVIGRAFRHPIAGTYELMELMMVPVVFGALAYAFSAGSHIRMEVVIQRLPARARAWLGGMAAIVGTAFVAAISWRLFSWGWESFVQKEITQGTVTISLHYFRFLAGLGLIPFALLFFESAIRQFTAAILWRRLKP